MMETFLAPERTEVDRIEAYLDRAFVPFKFDSIKAAAIFQTQLGIPVSPEDVDLIYTCEALAAETWTNDKKKPAGSCFRYNTQGFRDVVGEMRLDTQRELNEAVRKLEAGGYSHEEAVKQTLKRTVDPLTLRKEAIQVGYTTCMERSGPLIKREHARIVRFLVFSAFLLSFSALIYWASEDILNKYRGIGMSFYICILFLSVVGYTYSRPVRQLSTPLQASIDSFVTRKHFSKASLMQRIRWAVFKERYPSSSTPLLSWVLSLLLAVVTMVSMLATAFHFLGGLAAIFGYWSVSSMGQKIWALRDNSARLKANSLPD